ncbi:uncharacterized protein TNCT_314911 [Trichonephila clavata]|uniref:BPTI/Kunitz inhibitor domain-containing protein n=1 Tax=Trichonephila clavata TaxID=2740835 RepID=A0A8X6L660_TRICU|nr:uncharacterized protein TNCT_314911 [Trichonephila clavata]
MFYLDGGKSKSQKLAVTVTPAKTVERRAKQPSDGTLCYHEKILGLYDLSPESVPRELLQDLDIYIPSSCDSSIFDISPVYGILISEEQPNLNNVIQLTEEFVFFPLPEGKLTLPSCHLQSESPITTKYQVQMEENPLPHVICHSSGCAKWISVKDEDYTIPCDMKFAALVMIEETSAGKNIAPNLEIFESLSDTNTPLYTLNVIENTEVDTNEDQLKPVQVKYADGSKYCKYATLKIIKNLFPAAAITQDEQLTIVAEKECDNPVFKMVKGVALLLSKKLIEPNTAVPLEGDTIMVGILPGSTTISVCAQSTSIYFNLVPDNQAPDSSAYETVISSYTEVPETLVVDVPKSNEETFHEYATEPTYPATTIKYEEPPQVAVVDSLTTARTAPIIIQKPLIAGEEIAGTGASYCDGHKDQTCPVCGEINSLSSEVYCNAKSSLFARSTGFHYRNHTCSSGVLGTLYDITVRKVPIMALLRVLYSIPPHCSCPALERDGYLLLISEEYIPLTSPLTLQLSKGLHIYTANRGRSLLPGCVYSNPIQARSKILKNMVEMESVDKELHAILPELSYPSCPTIDHTCPKCGGMSDEELEELICSAEEVLLVSRNKTTEKIPTKPLRTGKTTFTQHLDEGNYVLEMNIDRYENTCTFPLAEGNCSGSIPRYYFDAEDEMCIEFAYSGCNGNANNFQSYAQCEDNCLIEDFCTEGSLSIEKIIKHSYASDYLNNEFIYAFPEHCNCWHMLQGKYI